MLLVLAVISFTTLSEVYADDISIEFDKLGYTTGGTLSITGQITDFNMPVIAMSIYDPERKIISANNIEIESEGIFTKTISLNPPFYEKSGQYEVKFDYGKISQTEFFSISNPSPDVIVEESLKPEIILLTSDKPQYSDNDIITINGSVSTLDSPTVLIGIYDAFGTPAGFYFEQINSDLSFSTSFLAKAGINFKVDGTYSIKAHYAESSEIISFDFFKVIEETVDEETIDENNSQNNNPNNESESTDDNQIKTEVKNNELSSDDNSTINSNSDENPSDINESIVKNHTGKTNEIKPVNNTIKELTTSGKIENQKKQDTKIENNLTVEDIELGLMLNQINLDCDSSKYIDTITYYDGMGPALYRLCNFEDALNFFNDSLIKNPDNIEILTNKGSTLGKLGFYSEAINFYDQALNVDPKFLPAINNKANALVNLGKYNEAKSLYQNAIENNPNYLTAKKNLTFLENESIQSNTSENPPIAEKSIHKIINEDVKTEKPALPKPQKENPSSLFEEISSAFSSLGSLFEFFN